MNDNENNREVKGEVDLKNFKYKFNTQEMSKMGKNISQSVIQKNELEDELRGIKAEYKGKIDPLEEKISTLSKKHQNGYEYRTVRCSLELNHVKKEREYYDLETGELIYKEPFKQGDQQRSLFKN